MSTCTEICPVVTLHSCDHIPASTRRRMEDAYLDSLLQTYGTPGAIRLAAKRAREAIRRWGYWPAPEATAADKAAVDAWDRADFAADHHAFSGWDGPDSDAHFTLTWPFHEAQT